MTSTEQDVAALPHWAAVPFPREAEERGPTRSGKAYSGHQPVQVPAELVEDLGLEELATFVRLTLWHQRGERATMERLADELWSGKISRAAMWVAELECRSLVITSSRYHALLEDLYPEMYKQRLTREARDEAYAERAERQRAERESRSASRAERERVAQAALAAHWNRYLPTEPDGSWVGPWPLEGSPRPPRGQAVVYILFGSLGRAVYAGSTDNFEQRTKAHLSGGKHWTSWVAMPYPDREKAYEAEGAYLAEYMPHLNVQGPQLRRKKVTR